MDNLAIKEIDNVKQWVGREDARQPCNLCNDFMKENYFQFKDGRFVCNDCIVNELRTMTGDYEPFGSGYKIKDHIQLVKNHKVIHRLYPMLTAYSYWHKYINPEDDDNLPLFRGIVDLMGHTGHPLSYDIRQLAFNISVRGCA